MTTKSLARRIEAIKPIIDQADIEGLFKLGAPGDEYNHEIEAIAASWYRMIDEKSALNVVNEVFNYYFDHHQASYPELARNIYAALRNLESIEQSHFLAPKKPSNL